MLHSYRQFDQYGSYCGDRDRARRIIRVVQLKSEIRQRRTVYCPSSLQLRAPININEGKHIFRALCTVPILSMSDHKYDIDSDVEQNFSLTSVGAEPKSVQELAAHVSVVQCVV